MISISAPADAANVFYYRLRRAVGLDTLLQVPRVTSFGPAAFRLDLGSAAVGVTVIQILLARTRPSFATIWLPFVDVVQLRGSCGRRVLRP
jgi:hypothetical protein